MPRECLPDRRTDLTTFQHRAILYTATVNFSDGRLAEIFIDCKWPGSAIAEHANTAAILASLLLQYGIAVEIIEHSISGPLAVALATVTEFQQ